MYLDIYVASKMQSKILTDDISLDVVKNIGQHVLIDRHVIFRGNNQKIGDYSYINGGVLYDVKWENSVLLGIMCA